MTETNRELIIECVNKLFVYTDSRMWNELKSEVFTETLNFDMTSLGGENTPGKAAEDICNEWKAGFEGIDAVNHLSGNHIVKVTGESAEVLVYATATHFKESTSQGNTREFVGSYDLHLVKTPAGWRINGFKYNLKYTSGNMSLE